jgi:hypothetical protein
MNFDIPKTVTVTPSVADKPAPRAARRARRQLRAELACYASQADRLELNAILNRHKPEEAEEIRSLMAALSSARR